MQEKRLFFFFLIILPDPYFLYMQLLENLVFVKFPRFLFLVHGSILIHGWSGGAMVLGNLPVPGRPTNLDKSRARAFCAYSRCGWGLFGLFSLVYLSLFFLPLSGRRPDIDEILSQKAIKPKTTNQPF